jgi:hypothetical protein
MQLDEHPPSEPALAHPVPWLHGAPCEQLLPTGVSPGGQTSTTHEPFWIA